jgi:hypothetical protein
MKTTYRGTNRAQNLKKYREMLAYQESKLDGNAKSLRDKYFAEPTRWERVKNFIKGVLSILAMGFVASVVFLTLLAYFSLAI